MFREYRNAGGGYTPAHIHIYIYIHSKMYICIYIDVYAWNDIQRHMYVNVKIPTHGFGRLRLKARGLHSPSSRLSLAAPTPRRIPVQALNIGSVQQPSSPLIGIPYNPM